MIALDAEEHGFTETDRACGRHLARVAGAPKLQELLDSLGRHGQDPAVEEVARLLPADQYDRFMDHYRRAEAPQRRWRRTRR